MTEVKIDFNEKIGNIKPMHAVGQPPFVGIDFSHIHWLKDAGIPYSRLHDVGGLYGKNMFVDIPNIFRDFDANENDPAAYDFVFTDLLIKGLMENNCPPVFRLGVTIENYFRIHRLRIIPPKDFMKWARICEHIIRHYNEGWANGFEYGIVYWEVWNEPDNELSAFNDGNISNPMWHGTKEQYFELYEVTAKHLKSCFGDTIKVGGYAATGLFYSLLDLPKENAPRYAYFNQFFEDFFAHLKKTQTPIDFFSWHSYVSTAETELMADNIDRCLCEYGYADIETHLNEWNNAGERKYHGTNIAASRFAAMMCAMQNKKTYMLNVYDARIGLGDYGCLFDTHTYLPNLSYKSFIAFNELYKLGTQVKCELERNGLYAVAATNGTKKAVLIANETENSFELSIPACEGMDVYIISDVHSLGPVAYDPASFTLDKYSVALIK
ncbi:MAG: hypothetical protein IJD67_02290 [Clostridia bacterium]|nr:hypothetical protein [Clostridia bacterium]